MANEPENEFIMTYTRLTGFAPPGDIFDCETKQKRAIERLYKEKRRRLVIVVNNGKSTGCAKWKKQK